MSESPEKFKANESYIQRAIVENSDFLAELAAFNSLEQMREVLPDLAYITEIDGKKIAVLPEVMNIPHTEDAEVVVYSEEQILQGLDVYINDPATDLEGLEQEVRGWIPHKDIADAVIRIVTKSINEKAS